MKKDHNSANKIKLIYNDLQKNNYTQILNSLVNEIVEQKPIIMDLLKYRPAKEITEHLPAIYIRPFKKNNPTLSCIILCAYRKNAFKFIHEILNSLAPERSSNISLFFAADFAIENKNDRVDFSIGEVALSISDYEDFKYIKNLLIASEQKLSIGISSEYHAQKVLLTTNINCDQKSIVVRKRLNHLMHRRPKYFDSSILTEMDKFMLKCPDTFRHKYSAEHLSRIIIVQSMLKKRLAIEDRSVLIKVSRRNDIESCLSLYCSFKIAANGKIVTIHQISRLLQSYLKDIYIDADDYLYNIENNGTLCNIYMSLKHSDGKKFYEEDINFLRYQLPNSVNSLLTDQNHHLLLPNNEEELLRNIINLSKELKYVESLPQVIISFDQQSQSKLSFSIILVRLIADNSESLKQLFKKNACIKFLSKKIKTVGLLRKKHQKEANIFKLEIPKGRFLRNDNSLDIIKARFFIANAIEQAVGPFRDYNGGMLTTQNGILMELKKQLDISEKNDEMLLENFFYALMPETSKNLAPIEMLKLCYNHLYQHIRSNHKNINKTALFETAEYTIAILNNNHPNVLDNIYDKISDQIALTPQKIFFSSINYHGNCYFCVLCNSKKIDVATILKSAIES